MYVTIILVTSELLFQALIRLALMTDRPGALRNLGFMVD